MRAIHVLFALILFALFCGFMAVITSARAAECYTPDQLRADAKIHDASIVGFAAWPGDNADLAIIIHDHTHIVLWAFKGGCFVSVVPLDSVSEPEPPSVPKADGGA